MQVNRMKSMGCTGLLLGMFVTPIVGVSAADSVLTHESTITAVRFPQAGETIAQIQTITCSYNVNYPHRSGHVPGTINVTANTSCSAPVSSISMDVGLALDWTLVGAQRFSNSGKSFLDGNAAVPCVSGYYRGIATTTVVFPPGYNPPTGSGTVLSPEVSIIC